MEYFCFMHKAIIFVHHFNRKQDHHQQLEDLRAIAKRKAVHVIAEIIDICQRGLPNQQREGLQQLLGLCRREAIQKVLVSEQSHLAVSQLEFARLYIELAQIGTSIYIHSSGYETFRNGQPNPFLLDMCKQIIEEARSERMREHTLAGIKTRQQGKTTGRPPGTTEESADFLAKYPLVIQQLQQNRGLRETARLCGVSINTVSKVKERL